VVTWSTDEAADALVVFGTTTDYGRATAPDRTLATVARADPERAVARDRVPLPGTVQGPGGGTLRFRATTRSRPGSRKIPHITIALRALDPEGDLVVVGEQRQTGIGSGVGSTHRVRFFVPLPKGIGSQVSGMAASDRLHTALYW